MRSKASFSEEDYTLFVLYKCFIYVKQFFFAKQVYKYKKVNNGIFPIKKVDKDAVGPINVFFYIFFLCGPLL